MGGIQPVRGQLSAEKLEAVNILPRQFIGRSKLGIKRGDVLPRSSVGATTESQFPSNLASPSIQVIPPPPGYAASIAKIVSPPKCSPIENPESAPATADQNLIKTFSVVACSNDTPAHGVFSTA